MRFLLAQNFPGAAGTILRLEPDAIHREQDPSLIAR
jgi:hypothetical protein